MWKSKLFVKGAFITDGSKVQVYVKKTILEGIHFSVDAKFAIF